MMGDLVLERLPDAAFQRVPGGMGAHQWTPEERDLAGDRGAIRSICGPRHTLIEPEEATGTHARELLGIGLVLHDDGHAGELLPERLGQVGDGSFERLIERITIHDGVALKGPPHRLAGDSLPPSGRGPSTAFWHLAGDWLEQGIRELLTVGDVEPLRVVEDGRLVGIVDRSRILAVIAGPAAITTTRFQTGWL